MAHAAGALVLIDGAQAVPHVPVDVQALGCDFYAFSGHKMLAPMGSGALWARRELLEAMPPFLAGGEMIREVHLRRSDFNEIPWKFEAGTPAVGDAIGLGVAAEYLTALGHGRGPRARARARRLRAGEPRARSPRTSSCTARWTRTCAAASSRSTCRASTRTTSPRSSTASAIAVRAGHHCTMPLHERLDLAATARASFNVYSTREDIDALVAGLLEVQRVFNG